MICQFKLISKSKNIKFDKPTLNRDMNYLLLWTDRILFFYIPQFLSVFMT